MTRIDPGALAQAVRVTFRGLRRRPGFTAGAILTLTLGIGANTAMFSVVESIVLRRLPYAEPDRLVVVWPQQYLGNREVAFLRANARTLDAVGSFSPGWLMGLTGVAEPTQISAGRISGNLVDLLGVRPALGRAFGLEAETPGQDRVVVLSDGLWRRSFGGDPGIVGRSIELDHQPYTVLGVMPPSFQILDSDTDLWAPLSMDQGAMHWAGQVTQIVGRLAPGASLASASSELRTLAASMGRAFSRPDDWARSARVSGWREEVVGGVRRTLLVLLAGVGFLLLIATANVANLLLVRTTERRHELALRFSLGASRGRVALLLLGESLALATLGGLGGLALAVGALRLAPAILPSDLPRLREIGLDGTVLAAAAGVVLLTALVFGAAPALHAAREASGGWLRTGRGASRSGGTTRGVLVAVEVAMAVVLLAGAGLMIRTVRALNSVDPGFRPDHLLTMKLQPSGLESQDALRAYWRTVLGRVRAVPGVEAAGSVLHLPTGGRKWQADLEVEGRPLDPGVTPPQAAWQSVSAGYLAAAGIALVRGRDIGPGDGADAPPVVLVNTEAERLLFPQEDPIGRRIKAGYGTRQRWATVVGVVGSVRHDSLNAAPGPEIYVPFEQTTVVATALIVRTSGDPAALAPAIVAAVRAVRAEVPISEVRSMHDVLAASIQRQRSVLALLGLFAMVGLALGGIGIYGVVSYGARQRAREIGIRVALGADSGSVTSLVVREGLTWAGVGLLAGLPVAAGLGAALRGLVFGVPITDPITYAGAAAGLVAVAAAASYLPARRAAGADPTVVLRDP